MKNRKLSKYEIAKQNRLRRVKNKSNARDLFLAGVVTLLGTLAVTMVAMQRTKYDRDEVEGHEEEKHLKRATTLEVAHHFHKLKRKGLSFTESYDDITPPVKGVKSARDTMVGSSESPGGIDKYNSWVKLWCCIGGEFNKAEIKGLNKEVADITQEDFITPADAEESKKLCGETNECGFEELGLTPKIVMEYIRANQRYDDV